MKLAVVGGGWAGMAAAVKAVRQGWDVTILEATRQWGGRARALDLQRPDGQHLRLDNGQHILIGAYRAALEFMETVGVAPNQALLDLPLGLPYPDGQGLSTPPWAALWPAPLDALAAMLTASGWTWSDRVALLQRSLRWRMRGFRCHPQATVADLCQGMPPRPIAELIEPLCVSALNLPCSQASGQVFLRVLQDALFGRGHRSLRPAHLLVPRIDLGALGPAPAANWLQARGAQVLAGARVVALASQSRGQWTLRWRAAGEEQQATFDQVILATPADVAGQLVQAASATLPPGETHDQLEHWGSQARQLPHTAIATVYAWAPEVRLRAPMLALRPHPKAATELSAQFVFDRGQIHPDDPAMQGVLAFVISAAPDDRVALEQAVVTQGMAQLGLPALQVIRTVVERRATFACVPAQSRPTAPIAPQLFAAGDYVDGPYPATIEGAVRSGEQAVDLIIRSAGLPR